MPLARSIHPAAYEQAVRKWALPPCLHVPIVAKDQSAIEDHIGEVVRVISPGKALLVRCDPPVPADMSLPIFSHPNVENLFVRDQIWVNPDYTRYRRAWKKALEPADIEGKVLHHVYNRRMARLREFGYIRLAPISRRTNSSSAFTEQWGVDLFTPEYLARLAGLELRMQYADLSDLLTMLDIPLGGGVQDVMRIGQNLVEAPGKRRPQC